ncbi:MAG TPA: NAD(P)-dependent oxidoreductase [Solirubrobacteraceae bacterium]|nr:NAD(P)-dependent oxidoreductase [Solirubrobacteraceae bacterium]
MSDAVLVTGASGFIGRAVLAALDGGPYEVHAVQRGPLPPGLPAAAAHRADLLDAAAAERIVQDVRPTRLLHLAWYARPGSFWTAPENRAWVEATLGLLRAFADAGGRRAVVAGTCAEYAAWPGPCAEATTPLEPATPYGAAKHECHERAAAHARAAGYGLAWARLFHPYGPHEPPERLVPAVVRSLLAGRPVDLSHGRQRRDFVYVADAASALVRLLGARLEGPVNVGTGRATSVRELVELVARRLGREGLARFGARPDDGAPPLVVADTRRASRELGWEPAVPLEEGVERSVSWWSR